jgi:hypothetical protein
MDNSVDEKSPLMMSSDNEFDDPDIIIPPSISWPLVVSSHLLLVTAIVALCYAIVYKW